MLGFKFDINDGDFVFDMGGNMGMDSKGNPMMNIGGNAMIDMQTGDIHFTTGGFDDNPFNGDNNND